MTASVHFPRGKATPSAPRQPPTPEDCGCRAPAEDKCRSRTDVCLGFVQEANSGGTTFARVRLPMPSRFWPRPAVGKPPFRSDAVEMAQERHLENHDRVHRRCPCVAVSMADEVPHEQEVHDVAHGSQEVALGNPRLETETAPRCFRGFLKPLLSGSRQSMRSSMPTGILSTKVPSGRMPACPVGSM